MAASSFTFSPDPLQPPLPSPSPSPFLLFGRVICSPPLPSSPSPTLACSTHDLVKPQPSDLVKTEASDPFTTEASDSEELRPKRSRWTSSPVPSPKHSDRSSDARSGSLVLSIDSPSDRNHGGCDRERERSQELGRKNGIECCADARQRQILDGAQDQRKAASMASLINKEQESQQASGKTTQCPRCESYNTKFCYFNNYNVKQPRHFCRNCQRYWTAGGALRNVPVGSGRRRASRARRSTENGAVPAQIHRADHVVGASAEILRVDHVAAIALSSSSSSSSSSPPASASHTKQEWQGLATQNAPLSSIPCKPASLVCSSSSPLASVCDPPQNPPSRENVSISISSAAADSSIPADPNETQSFMPHIPHIGGVTGTPFIFHVPFTYQPPEAPAPAIVVLPYNASLLPWTCLATNSSSSSAPANAQTPPLPQSHPTPPSVAPRNHPRHNHNTTPSSAFHPFHSSDPAVINPTPFFAKIKAEKMDET